jgi:AAA15 family ATPase/GTPase
MFRIYELKGFLSMEEEHIIKRTQMASFFGKIDFPKSNLLKLLRECLQTIKETAPEEK